MDKQNTGVTVTTLHSRAVTYGWLIALIVVGPVIGGGWVVWSRLRRPADPAGQSSSPVKSAAAASVRARVDQAYAHNDYDSAIQALRAQADQGQDTQLQLAAAYANKGDYRQALAIYTALDRQNRLTPGYLSGAAEVAAAANDKPAAIHYYQEAKDRTLADKQHIAAWQSNVQSYDAAINRLRQP